MPDLLSDGWRDVVAAWKLDQCIRRYVEASRRDRVAHRQRRDEYERMFRLEMADLRTIRPYPAATPAERAYLEQLARKMGHAPVQAESMAAYVATERQRYGVREWER